MRGAARVVFAAILLLIVGTLNIIYGIGALDDANIFVNDTRYILTNLNALGWVLIILGVIQLTGGFSLMAGNVYGRVIGIVGGSLGAIGALLSIGGAFPWWSLAIFFLTLAGRCARAFLLMPPGRLPRPRQLQSNSRQRQLHSLWLRRAERVKRGVKCLMYT